MSPSVNQLRIATRKSPLALVQAEWVASRLKELHPTLSITLVPLVTEGDRFLSAPLIEAGGKGLFVKELEQALLGNQADIAVHSMKDMTAIYPDGLTVPVICERIDPRDVLVTHHGVLDLFSLPDGAKVGTSSLRRQCQLLSYRPDLQVVALRGNVNTRLQKLDDGEFDALVLAAAGLERLGVERATCLLSTEVCLPAAGQGALGIECREDDAAIRNLIAPLNDLTTFFEVKAERAFSARLNGGCRAPIAAFAQVSGDRLLIRGLVGRPDGSLTLRSQRVGHVTEARELGTLLADELLSQGADQIIQDL